MMVRLPRNGRGSSGHAEKIITRPLFTNYLFIQIDILRQPWQRINFTRGIRHLLTGASNKIDDNNDPIEQTPIPIKATVINYLLKNPIHYANPGPFLFQRVKLLTPILMNEVGTITQISKHTIEVLLDSTNHTVRTPKSQIERIEGHDGERKLEGP
jgi:transcription antitermination factor NusG